MSAPEIRLSNDAIIKALQAFGPTDRDYSKQVIAALKVAAPHILIAELEAQEKVVDQNLQDAEPANFEEDNYDAGYIEGLTDVQNQLRSRITELKAALS